MRLPSTANCYAALHSQLVSAEHPLTEMIPREVFHDAFTPGRTVTANQIRAIVQELDRPRQHANVVGGDHDSVEAVHNNVSGFTSRDLCQPTGRCFISRLGTPFQRGGKYMYGTRAIDILDILPETQHLHAVRQVGQIRQNLVMWLTSQPKLGILEL